MQWHRDVQGSMHFAGLHHTLWFRTVTASPHDAHTTKHVTTHPHRLLRGVATTIPPAQCAPINDVTVQHECDCCDGTGELVKAHGFVAHRPSASLHRWWRLHACLRSQESKQQPQRGPASVHSRMGGRANIDMRRPFCLPRMHCRRAEPSRCMSDGCVACTIKRTAWQPSNTSTFTTLHHSTTQTPLHKNFARQPRRPPHNVHATSSTWHAATTSTATAQRQRAFWHVVSQAESGRVAAAMHELELLLLLQRAREMKYAPCASTMHLLSTALPPSRATKM